MTEKVEYAYRLLDTAYLLRNEPFNDHCKRSILRFFFIQVDNLLKLVPRLKNKLVREGALAIEQRRLVETRTDTIVRSYERAYDIIRDKVAAHGQIVDLLSLLDWWSALDYSTVEVLYSDAKELQSLLEPAIGRRFLPIPDYAPLPAFNGKLAVTAAQPRLAVDRFAAARPSTAYMLACHETQEKAMLVVSVIDFLDTDFALTMITNAPHSLYTRFAFDIGWLLAIVDLCSLVDNLFEDNDFDRSLMSLWSSDISGHSVLVKEQSLRDRHLESKVRALRNELAAHIDDSTPLGDLSSSFERLDLAAVHAYATRLVKAFFDACRMDIRTRLFLIRDTPLSGVALIPSKGAPFDG